MARDDSASDTEASGWFELNRRNFLQTSAAGAATLGAVGSTAAASSDSVTIIHGTHFHGRFQGPSGVNIAQYANYVNKLRNENDNAGFVGIGDDFSPSVMGFVFKGEHMVEALNYLDPVVDGVGNHEFDFGVDNATTQFQHSEFPWVVANLLTPDGDPIPGTERWTLEQLGDYTVGFFGSGVEDFHSITAYPEEYQVIDPVDAAKEATAALKRKGADVVVMASHTNSSTHDEIAKAVDDLDAIVGSHSGVVQESAEQVSGTVISEVGDQFGWLAEVHLDPATGDLVEWERHDLGSQSDSLSEDANMRAIANKWQSRLDDELGQTAFRTATELDARFSTNYAAESAIGNLITDVMREEMDADVGLQNPGGIRSNSVYGPGAITGEDVYNILPFPNKVVKAEVTGKTLRETLEVSVSALPWSYYGIQAGAQVSGLQYEFSGTGDAVATNFYVDGEPLQDDETYTLATNDYVFNNWDGFSDAERLATTEDFLGTIVIDRLGEDGVVEPDVDNRILRVDEDAGVAETDVEDDSVTVRFDVPEKASAVYGETFVARTEFGHEVEATRVEVTDGTIAATFDEEALSTLASGPKDPDIRVFGGFEPDDAAYDYRDDGDLIELPVAARTYYFTVKAAVPTNGRGPNPFGGPGNSQADEHGGSEPKGGPSETQPGGRKRGQNDHDHGSHGH